MAVLGSTFSFIVGCNDTASVDSYLPKTVGFYLPKIVDAKLPLTASSDGTYTNRSKYLWFGIKGSTYIKNSATTGYTGNVTETVGVNNKTYIEGGFDRQIGMCVRLVWDAN